MPEKSWLLYGANGYTGQLVAREAARRGQRPILAGRDAEKLEPLSRELGLEVRAFVLSEASAHLRNVDAVLHCAGPFSETSAPMVQACLDSGAHYLDITGEIAVFEEILQRGEDAKQAGIAMIPGVGFDVVPTDCLAVMLAEALPGATELTLAFYSRGSSMSRGTFRTMLEGLPQGGAIRRDGRIVRVPAAWHAREIPFTGGTRWAVTIPWGDVSTAWHSTGIPNIRVYSAARRRAIRVLKLARPLTQLLRIRAVLRAAERAFAPEGGADEATRLRARTYLWGEARRNADVVSLAMETPEAYTLTAMTAVSAVEEVLSGAVGSGVWTPARAFGSRFIARFPGVVVRSLDRSSG